MGIYLNSISSYSLYKSEYTRPYFVDKSSLLKELIPLAEQGNAHICITRPRRFGKTVMANMIGAFFSKGVESSDVFDRLQISADKDYRKHLNQHNVIYIDFSKMPGNCKSYMEYITRIEERLKRDLLKVYSEIEIYPEDSLWDILESIFIEYNGQKFIFIFDEWDCIFHKNFVTEEDRQNYISFLSNLLKDHAYVSLSYMTGILPIAKYSSGSELNMFIEYTMASEEKFSEDFGFTESETDMLYRRYLEICRNEEKTPYVTREGLETWYDGYYAKNGERMYNPRSVVASLTNNNLDSYWTSSGPYDEIFYYVKNNVAEVRNDLAVMISGEGVPAKIKEYAATSMNLTTREEILSAMVVYGFLSYYQGKVYIPNKELMDKFDEMLQKEASLGYVYRLAKESERMLKATLEKDLNKSKANLEKYQKQYKQMYDDKLNDLIPEFLFKEKKQELDSKIKNEKEKLQEAETKFNTLNKLEDKEELIFKAIDDIKKNGLTKEELSRLFDKIVVFAPQEITKEQKEEYNLNEEMYKELYENGGLAFHLKFMYPQTITNRRM